MDKRVMFAVAGSGKTTHIINNLSNNKRSLIITYTNGNYNNLRNRITEKFNNTWPKNVTLLTYFSFLYSFCYKPFLADKIKARGIIYNQEIIGKEQERKRKRGIKSTQDAYYMTEEKYFHSNRLALYIENNILPDVKSRIVKYFDEFIIDEVQDISGRDFNLLENLMTTEIVMLFVGDFYQHTFDTSRDGATNKTLYNDKVKYESRFVNKGFLIDSTTLVNSWRCSKNVCQYVQCHLGIEISSNRPESDNTKIEYITEPALINSIFNDRQIIKLYYQNGAKNGDGHKNWGDSKGEDHHHDVCVVINKTTAKKRTAGKLAELPASTKNKFYVAITRARGNVYLIDESCIEK